MFMNEAEELMSMVEILENKCLPILNKEENEVYVLKMETFLEVVDAIEARKKGYSSVEYYIYNALIAAKRLANVIGQGKGWLSEVACLDLPQDNPDLESLEFKPNDPVILNYGDKAHKMNMSWNDFLEMYLIRLSAELKEEIKNRRLNK